VPAVERRGGFRAKLRFLSYLVLLALGACWATVGWAASESLRIRVQRPLEDDALIDEAVNRVIGELSALGFDVEVLRRRTEPSELERPGQLDPGTEGALVFARHGGEVVVSAWVANGEHAFVQRYQAGEPSSGPGVIAVNAVEALRGVLIEPGAKSPEVAPGSSEAAPSPSAAERPPEPVAAPPSTEDTTPITPPDIPGARAFSATLFFAPNVGLEAQGRGTAGVGAALALGYDAISVGAGLERTLYVEAVRTDAGAARLTRTSGFATLRGKLRLADAWDGFTQLSIGVANYQVQAEAEMGFVATDRGHSDFMLGLGVGAAHWPLAHLGWFVGLDALMLPTPIDVRMENRGVAKLGAPAALLSLGVAARVR
jgi:hypothetical protein